MSEKRYRIDVSEEAYKYLKGYAEEEEITLSAAIDDIVIGEGDRSIDRMIEGLTKLQRVKR